MVEKGGAVGKAKDCLPFDNSNDFEPAVLQKRAEAGDGGAVADVLL